MTTPKYTSIASLAKHLGIYTTVPDKDSTSLEVVGTGNGSAVTYWLDQIGVLDGTYTLYYGATEAAALSQPLTYTTHYTIDLDTSKITLTGAGATLVSTNNIYAEYAYNREGILSAELLKAINAAETRIELYTEQRFADGTAADPLYRKITDEVIKGHYSPEDKVYDFFWSPSVEIQTTVDGDYTTGGVTLTVADGTGLPNTGTIYIGGNKVAYTARSTNDLTVPATTPSIADEAIVSSIVVEVSREPEGSDPSYEVLTYDQDYQLDFLHGRVLLLRNAYWGEINAEDRLYPSNYLIRVSYMSAWYEKGSQPTIPDEIQEVANLIAGKNMIFRTVQKSYTSGMNDFNPTTINSADDYIEEILEYYKPLHVGTSQYNKQFIS